MRRLLAALLLLSACRTVEQSPDWDQPSRIAVDKETGEPVVVLGAGADEDPTAEEKKVERGDDPALADFLSGEERALLRDADELRLFELGAAGGDAHPVVRIARVTDPGSRQQLRARIYRALSDLSFSPAQGGGGGGELVFSDEPGWLALEARARSGRLFLLFDLGEGRAKVLGAEGRERRARPSELEAAWRLAFGPAFEELGGRSPDELRRGLASPRARVETAEALAEEGARAAELLPEVRAALRAVPDARVWPPLLVYLRRLGPGAAAAVPELVAILERDWTPDLAPAREAVIRPSEAEPLGDVAAPPRISEARREDLIAAAIEALGAIGPEARAARPALERLAASGDAALAEAARAALAKLE